MIVFQTISLLKEKLLALRFAGKKIGFVPTMGALHEGHLSLIAASKKQNDFTVCSIFINKAQFNNEEDFIKYPVTKEQDILQLAMAGTEIIFMPSPEEMQRYTSYEPLQYDLQNIENVLEGKYRPGHFQGVCQVVEKLLHIIMPDTLYLGQKDFQQCLVLDMLVRQMNIPVQIQVCPIARTPDGLAMSSRNMRLSEDGRKKATTIFKVLTEIKTNLTDTNWAACQQKARQQLLDNGFEKVDYIEMCDPHTLEILTYAPAGKEVVLLVAAFIENIRLIDNMKTSASILTN